MSRKREGGGNANPSASLGTEMFPDLHMKMSKKIAQLTKVIYHLNTRNEDFDVNLRAEKKNHANEVEEILKDAADKINKFKAQLAKAKENSATANALKQLRSQHEKERDAAMKEFSVYKGRVQTREDSLRKEFKEKIRGMKKDLDGAKKLFKSRLKEFSDAQNAIKDHASITTSELDALKKSHKEEMDALKQERLMIDREMKLFNFHFFSMTNRDTQFKSGQTASVA